MASSLRSKLEGSLIWKQEPYCYQTVKNRTASTAVELRPSKPDEFIRDEDLPPLPNEHYTSVWEAILACL